MDFMFIKPYRKCLIRLQLSHKIKKINPQKTQKHILL